MSLTTDHPAGTTTGRRPGAPAPRGQVVRLATIALGAVVAGLALGRFLWLQPAPAASRPVMAAAAPTQAELVASLEQAVEREPTDLRSWQRLGVAYLDRATETADVAFYDLSDRAFDRAEQLQPGDVETMIGRGTLALSLHEFDRALALGQQASAANPFSAEALGVVVDAKVELGRYRDAATDLQRMLDLKPNLAALSRASYLRELHGDLLGARQAMIQAEVAGAGQGFDAATVSALVGDLALKAGDYADADAAYSRAEASAPGLAAAAVGRARLLAAQGNRAGAIALLRDLVDRAPQPAAAILLANLLTLSGDDAAARDAEDLVRAIAALQADVGQVVDLELALFEADRGGDPQRALALARRAHDARPANVFTNDALAWALHRAGDSDRAAGHAEQALRLDTADVGLRYRAAEVLAAAGRPARAAEALRSAFALDPAFLPRHVADARALAERLGAEAPGRWTRP